MNPIPIVPFGKETNLGGDEVADSVQVVLYPEHPPSIHDAEQGRSTRRIAASEPLIEKGSYFDCGNSKTEQSVCFTCRAQSNAHCIVCKSVFYCSKNCQKAHWQFHKNWCKKAVMHKDLSPDRFQLKVDVGRRYDHRCCVITELVLS